MEIHLGEAGVLVWGEDVAVVVPEGVCGLLVEVDGDGAVLEVVERADVVEASDKGIVIDLGTHGKVTLNAVTQKQFEDELNKIAEEINKIGDELRNMSEEDINQFLAVLGTAIEAEANGAMATNK